MLLDGSDKTEIKRYFQISTWLIKIVIHKNLAY